MARMSLTNFGRPRLSDRDPRPSSKRRAEGVGWPAAPRYLARINDGPVAVDVEMCSTAEGVAITGIAVRTLVPTHAGGSAEDPWAEGADFEEVTATLVRRLPLASYARAAKALCAGLVGSPEPEVPETKAVPEPAPVRLPRGRPKRGASEGFYRELARAARALQAQGKAPIPEIARRKRVSTNLANQWLFQARRLED